MPDKKPKVIAYAAPDRFFQQRRIEMLERLGFTVIFCRCAKEVLDLFSPGSPNQPDILISDIFLAHGHEFSQDETNDGTETGFRIYRWIRVAHPVLPVILLTTNGEALVRILGISGSDKNLYMLSEGVGNTKNILHRIAEDLK